MAYDPPPHAPAWPAEEPEPRAIRVIRPTDGSLVGELAVTPRPTVPSRVSRTRSVQEGWASLDPDDRVRRLRGLVDAIGSRAGEIAETIVAETGKPRAEALIEVTTVLDLLRFYLRKAPGFLARKRVSAGWLLWKEAFVVREPLGVVGIISPWNYPFILSMTPVITALFGGNGAVLKPSELTPYSGLFAEDLCREAGLPEGLVQVIVGTGSVGAALVRSGVDKVVFTGGTETGRRVLAAASESLTPVVLELGGKDAAIVLEDADLERSARGVLWGAFQNAGQTCIAVERVFVVEEVYDRFLKQLLQEMRKIRAGSTAGVDVGPMVMPEQLDRVEAHLQDAVDQGGKVLAGGHRADPASNVFHPTVLTGVGQGCEILREETFGPLLPVIPVKDQEEAIRRANETRFGLSASVWTGDRRRGMEVARRLRVGGVTVNDALVHYGIPSLPFGGVGESGFGRTRGLEGLAEMTRTRTVVVDRLGLRREPWWFPYSRVTERLLWATLLFRWKGGLRGLISGTVALVRKKRG
jgi:succinate-semialdehyde dehydrogenase/glutarate-semialdehyde dehydrogenase